MSILPKSVTNLIDELAKLPGVGPKTASRLAFYLISRQKEEIGDLGNAIIKLKDSLMTCQRCFSISENELCPICSNPSRDIALLMVVEEPLDIVALERTGYQGLYHVLGGAISPIDGIGPDNLRLQELFERIKKEVSPIKEIIIATDPSLEGEATALYISNIIGHAIEQGEIKKTLILSRIARGLPVGGDLEYADEITLRRAIEGRRPA